MNTTFPLDLITDRITHLSILILEKKYYSEEFKTFINLEMTEDWSSVIEEHVDTYPYPLMVWKLHLKCDNISISQIGNTNYYSIWAYFSCSINNKEECSDLVMDLEYDLDTNELLFFKVYCP